MFIFGNFVVAFQQFYFDISFIWKLKLSDYCVDIFRKTFKF